jgi:hypothetical protein
MQSSWRRGSWGLVGISALLWLAACAGNPMPASLTFEGRKLELATEWSRGGVRGVVFVTPGQKLPLAHLQVGILASTEHKTGKALQAWVTDQYRMSGGIQNHEANEGDESCKIGVQQSNRQFRPFISHQVCRTGARRSVCAEIDTALDEDYTSCANSKDACQQLCDTRWTAARAALEPIVEEVLAKP